jgi:transcriptional regulator with XRE-family HTH domain
MTQENNNKDDFASRLKKVRKALKLRQKEFAECLGIAGPTLSELESGKYKPGHDFFRKISREFNVNLYYLMFGKGDMFLNELSSYTTRNKNFSINLQDVQNFLYYFERSPLVQYHIMSSFRAILHREKEAIEKEMEENSKQE